MANFLNVSFFLLSVDVFPLLPYPHPHVWPALSPPPPPPVLLWPGCLLHASSGTLLSGAKVATAAAGLAVEREGRLGEKPAPVPPPGEDALRSGGAAPSEPGSSGKAGRGRWRMVQSHLAAGKLNLSK